MFNVEFIDNTGEIRASGFNEQLDKFYDMLQIDNVIARLKYLLNLSKFVTFMSKKKKKYFS